MLAFRLEDKGVAVLGALQGGGPTLVLPDLRYQSLRELVPLSMIVALIVMLQTATVSRTFPGPQGIDINRDYLGLGAANLGAALLGSFPVNASPPLTAVVKEAGGTSHAGALVAAAVVLALAFEGGALLAHVPQAALAGVLLLVTSGGASPAGWVGGKIFDMYGSYQRAWELNIAITVIGILAIVFAAMPKHSSEASAVARAA